MNKNIKKTNTKNIEAKNFSQPSFFSLSSVNKKPVEVSSTAEKILTDGGLSFLNKASISNCQVSSRNFGIVLNLL